LVFFTLKYGQIYGTILGSIFGLLFDIVTGGFLGSTMFSLTLSGFIAGYFYSDTRQEFYSSTYFFLIIIFITAFSNSFLTILLSSTEVKLSVSSLILEQGVLPAIYTSIISLPILLYNQRRRRI
jgi:rod shape-determining protein MreD